MIEVLHSRVAIDAVEQIVDGFIEVLGADTFEFPFTWFAGHGFWFRRVAFKAIVVGEFFLGSQFS